MGWKTMAVAANVHNAATIFLGTVPTYQMSGGAKAPGCGDEKKGTKKLQGMRSLVLAGMVAPRGDYSFSYA